MLPWELRDILLKHMGSGIYISNERTILFVYALSQAGIENLITSVNLRFLCADFCKTTKIYLAIIYNTFCLYFH